MFRAWMNSPRWLTNRYRVLGRIVILWAVALMLNTVLFWRGVGRVPTLQSWALWFVISGSLIVMPLMFGALLHPWGDRLYPFLQVIDRRNEADSSMVILSGIVAAMVFWVVYVLTSVLNLNLWPQTPALRYQLTAVCFYLVVAVMLVTSYFPIKAPDEPSEGE